MPSLNPLPDGLFWFWTLLLVVVVCFCFNQGAGQLRKKKVKKISTAKEHTPSYVLNSNIMAFFKGCEKDVPF